MNISANSLELSRNNSFNYDYKELVDSLQDRVENFDIVFNTLQKVLIDKYNFFLTYGKSFSKCSATTEDGLKLLRFYSENGANVANYLSNVFSTLGEDLTKIFSSLLQDLQQSLDDTNKHFLSLKTNTVIAASDGIRNYLITEKNYHILLDQYEKSAAETDKIITKFETSLTNTNSYNLT